MSIRFKKTLGFYMFAYVLIFSGTFCQEEDDDSAKSEITESNLPQIPPENEYSMFHTKKLNMTSVLNKQIHLPCFVEKGRKFIWMKADRNEILTIDSMMITSDRRFGIELASDCYDKPTATAKSEGSNGVRVSVFNSKNNETFISESNNQVITLDNYGCWVYLTIENINASDEGLYVCQINTMSTTRIQLNVLVPPYLNRKMTLPNRPVGESSSKNEIAFNNGKSGVIDETKTNINQMMDTNIDLFEGNSVDLICGASGKPEPTIKWFAFDYETSNSIYLKSKSFHF